MATIRWRHYNGTVDDTGVMFVSGDQPTGTHAISVGGFVGPRRGWESSDETNTDIYGNHVHPMLSVAGNRVEYDSGSDTLSGAVAVAGPPGMPFRLHMYVITEE